MAALQAGIVASNSLGDAYNLTRVEYPIGLRENGDWAQYIDEYREDPFLEPPQMVPDTPGIAIIDQTGKFYAIRHGSYDTQAGVEWVQRKLAELLYVNLDYRIYPRLTEPQFVPRWVRVAYLIVNFRVKELFKQIDIRPEKRFNEVVIKHLDAYVRDSVMPPKDIAPAILNLADDYMAGRPMSLRAGDYIAIQNHLRKST